MLQGKNILVTGGTGSFGKQFCEHAIKQLNPQRLIVYSRDEFKQAEMMQEPRFQHPCMRFFLGDVRDPARLTRAMADVDVVVHAAALKQVPAAEYNPHEFIKTNINGAMNVVESALSAGVQRVIALSTDKAVNPINLYGATKLCSDKVFISANSYSGKKKTRFSVVRYGNVVGSRGSVIPLFIKQRKTGRLTITDPRMTRFFLTIEDGASFVVKCLDLMVGGELFVPKIPSCKIIDLAQAIAPDCEHKITGIRPGEKLHEILIPSDESQNALDFGDRYIILPFMRYWEGNLCTIGAKSVSDGFSYASDTNPIWLSDKELKAMCRKIEQEITHREQFSH
ncbi:MAG: UDP-N-acetylglucosamine 4,6-dehydratase (inverting) [Verrucomicrobia bacterium GWC2_42_7]|nr:MAG: UDP-N-acetylglucosamine 4,6-dehydratase (inverting) [Verrucomicrobia bacterium GWC2_42_7]